MFLKQLSDEQVQIIVSLKMNALKKIMILQQTS